MASYETAILYQNPSQTVTLIDIPKSLALAQEILGDPDQCVSPGLRQPCSSPAPKAPYPSTEPKSAKLRTAWRDAQDPFPSGLLRRALATINSGFTEIKGSASSTWCLPRHFCGAESWETTSRANPILGNLSMIDSWSAQSPIMLPLQGVSRLNVTQVINRLVCSKSSSSIRLSFNDSNTEYHIPPLSRFLISKITPATVMSFSMAAMHEYPARSTTTSAGAGEFDVIILDPPWPNRSVRRSRHYQTMEPDENPLDALSNVLAQHIAPGALVACWITNKAAVREKALDIFARWDLSVVEEWVWLKVTSEGEPVTDIEGVWRKPYELLLIGRKSGAGDSTDSCENRNERARKVIVAVPGLHSQKPHLGELIKQLLPGVITDYRVLEIFARNLTASWWAWGNDVLKFNDGQAWHATQNDSDLEVTVVA